MVQVHNSADWRLVFTGIAGGAVGGYIAGQGGDVNVALGFVLVYVSGLLVGMAAPGDVLKRIRAQRM